MNNLEKQVLQFIGEDTESPDVFLDTDDGIAPIRDSINDAIEEISFIAGSYKRVYSLPMVRNKSFYRLKINDGEIGWVTDAILVNYKRRIIQTDVIQLTARDPRWLETTGTPTDYLQIGKDIIGVYPRPSGETDILQLTCVVIPKRYKQDADRIKLLEMYKRAVVDYAISEYWASRGSANDAKIHLARYLEVLGMRENHPKYAERPSHLETKNDFSRTT